MFSLIIDEENIPERIVFPVMVEKLNTFSAIEKSLPSKTENWSG